MKRLTNKGCKFLTPAIASKDMLLKEIESHQKYYDKLAEYEDLEEQGLLVKLPCKVGDTAYFPYIDNDGEKTISEYKIIGIVLKEDGWYTLDSDGKIDKIGEEYCYLTIEDAEARLKEPEGKHE